MRLRGTLTVLAAFAAGVLCANPMTLKWDGGVPAAPTAVARPFAGLLGDKLVVAGGSTFTDGVKAYSATISVYDTKAKTWTVLDKALPQGTAEGGAWVVNAGSAVAPKPALLCVGGVTAAGPTGDAFLLDAAGAVTDLPDFPAGTLSMPAAAAWKPGMTANAWADGAVFVGGSLGGAPTNRAFALGQKDGKWEWAELPALPGPARVQAVAVTQNGDQKSFILAVFGGSDGKAALTDGWGYTKTFEGDWAWKPLEGAPVCTVGASFLPVGDQHALLVGGYDGETWNAANATPAVEWAAKTAAWTPADYKWNRGIYSWHAVTGKWAAFGELPEGQLPRCGAAAAILPAADGQGTRLLVAGGETMPRVRTAEANLATFERQGWRFDWESWVVIGLFFASMIGMGVYFALKPKTADTYFRGGKSIPWYVAGVSIYATMLSSITFISIPTMTYISDWRYFTMALCILALAPIAIYFYLPFFCRLNITSAYEYLERRFNVGVRLFGAAAFNVFMVCRVAVVTLLPAIALGAVTDIPIWVAILLCGVATIIYCFFGGVDAVIWCDFVQGLILLFGAIVVLVVLVMESGGVGEFASVAWGAKKFTMWDFRPLLSEPVFWVVLIMGFVSNLNSYTADQCVVQRYITTPDEKAAARSIWFNGILSVISSVIFYLIGTALYTHYFKHPELMDVTMPKSDSIFPTFMAIELHPVIAGLIVASIFAATISTLATNLNSSATSIVTDFIARFRKDMDGDAQVRWGRWLVIVVGGLGVVAALILAEMPNRSLFDAFQNFIGTLTGGLSALFLIGIFMPRVSGAAAMIALVVNYVISLGIGYVCPGLHFFTYGGIGLAACVIVAWVLSFVLPNRKDTNGLTHFSPPQKEEA